MIYKYISPTEKGYIRIPVSRRQHNRFVPTRKQPFGGKVEYYWHPETSWFEAQYFCSLWMKVILITVMFIPSVIMQGVPETIRDIGNLIHERKRGKFSADSWIIRDRDDPVAKHIRRYVH